MASPTIAMLMAHSSISHFNQMIQRQRLLKVVPSYIIGYWAGDYFQVLRHIIAPAALMVRQQSSLIITPEWEYSS